MKWYTIREAAAILGVSKPTVRRLMEALPPEDISSGSYRGQPTILLSQKGLNELLGQREADHEAQNEAQEGENSENKDNELVQALKDRIKAQEDQIIRLSDALEKAQEATAAAQALHAATAEQLKLLTSSRMAQDEQEDKEGIDTAQEQETQQEPHREAEKASLRERLRILFTGR